MKLYTSYWGQVRNFPKNLVVLSTVVWEPKWYNVGNVDKNGIISLRCHPLVPGEECEGLCEGKCNPKHPNDCTFLKAYREQLDKIDFNDFMDKLLDLRARLLDDFPDREDFDFAFVFYEKYDNPCSERWAVQDWLRAHNIEIEEWKKC